MLDDVHKTKSAIATRPWRRLDHVTGSSEWDVARVTSCNNPKQRGTCNLHRPPSWYMQAFTNRSTYLSSIFTSSATGEAEANGKQRPRATHTLASSLHIPRPRAFEGGTSSRRHSPALNVHIRTQYAGPRAYARDIACTRATSPCLKYFRHFARANYIRSLLSVT